ncbi:MAG: hypothetical protein AAF959_16170, partial [Cyanobacteria bacterium P01_D01_bin.56]
LDRIMDALEPLGLVRSLLLQSSDSGGLHLYLPFTEALPSWQVGVVLAALLEGKGYQLQPGWLEVFPNQRRYSPDGQMSLFNGHRLPLQRGSYLLDESLELCFSSHERFAKRWAIAAGGNIIDKKTLSQVLKKAVRKNYRVTAKAAQFLNDLDTEIEAGWTGHGQTNHLLGRICMRSYIFAHVLYASKPLTGSKLAADIVRIAHALPGFTDWCGHQHDLETKAKHWARCIETSDKYYPYGRDKLPSTAAKDGPTWNERQQLATKERIVTAMETLITDEQWPNGITERFDLLVKQGVGGNSLYRHKELWHPRYQKSAENLPEESAERHGQEGQPHSAKLIDQADCNSSNHKGFGHDKVSQKKSGSKNQGQDTKEKKCDPIQQLKLQLQQTIEAVQNTRQKLKQSAKAQDKDASQAAYIEKLRAWLDSGDPILMAEARARLEGLGLSP